MRYTASILFLFIFLAGGVMSQDVIDVTPRYRRIRRDS